MLLGLAAFYLLWSGLSAPSCSCQCLLSTTRCQVLTGQPRSPASPGSDKFPSNNADPPPPGQLVVVVGLAGRQRAERRVSASSNSRPRSLHNEISGRVDRARRAHKCVGAGRRAEQSGRSRAAAPSRPPQVPLD